MESKSGPLPEPDAETTTPATDPSEHFAPEDVAEPDNAVDETAESREQPGSGMPDASSLVAMAAMHMETSALIHVLVSVFDSHAWRSMGLVATYDGEVKKDMPSAQIAIDCLAFLLGKIEVSLGDSEKRDVQRRLMDLRMNYVAKMRED